MSQSIMVHHHDLEGVQQQRRLIWGFESLKCNSLHRLGDAPANLTASDSLASHFGTNWEARQQ